MNYIPQGCDQQGRHPEAAHAATDVGDDYESDADHAARALFWRAYLAVIALAAIGAAFWPY